MCSTLIIFLLLLHISSMSSRRSPPNLTVHLVPHTHLDPGWKMTTAATYQTLAVPIYKKTLLELLLSPHRTFTIDTMLFFHQFYADSRDTPISANVGGYTSPLEMYTQAVTASLTHRATTLEPGIAHAKDTGGGSEAFTTPDADRLWRWKQVPTVQLQAIAAVLHDHEGHPETGTTAPHSERGNEEGAATQRRRPGDGDPATATQRRRPSDGDPATATQRRRPSDGDPAQNALPARNERRIRK